MHGGSEYCERYHEGFFCQGKRWGRILPIILPTFYSKNGAIITNNYKLLAFITLRPSASFCCCNERCLDQESIFQFKPNFFFKINSVIILHLDRDYKIQGDRG